MARSKKADCTNVPPSAAPLHLRLCEADGNIASYELPPTEAHWVRRFVDQWTHLRDWLAEEETNPFGNPSDWRIRRDMSALLHDLRPLTLEGECSSFPRVRKMLSRCIARADLRAKLDEVLALYNGKTVQRSVVVHGPAEPVVLSTPGNLEAWLNAREYHRDPGREEEIWKSIGQEIGDDAVRKGAEFVLIVRIYAIHLLARLIREMLAPGGLDATKLQHSKASASEE